MTLASSTRRTTLLNLNIHALNIVSQFPDPEDLTIEQCAELAQVLRKQLDDKTGSLPQYVDALMEKVDTHLSDQGVRSFEVPGIVKYSFSEIPGRYKFVNIDRLWNKLRRKKISREAAFDYVPSTAKLAKLIEDGRIPVDFCDEFTEQGEGYIRHSIKLLNGD
jgi:hypothetical protein